MRKKISFRPTLNDKLEDRAVPSGFSGWESHIQVQAFHVGQGGGGELGGGQTGGGESGNLGSGIGEGSGVSEGGSGATSSSLLATDSQAVQKAFQTFSSSMTQALVALRGTASLTGGPSTTGIQNFTAAVGSLTPTPATGAIGALNSAITNALINLPNTGPGLLTSINPILTTLQTDLTSAGTSGLKNSTSSAVRATQQEINGYIRTLNQVVTLIRNDTALNSITSTTLQTYYNQPVHTAIQAFDSAINAAAQASISGGTALSSNSAVNTAVTKLQGALDAAITTGLGTGLTTFAPTLTTTVNTDLATLLLNLNNIVAPTAGNSSAHLFLRSINSTISQSLASINQTVDAAIVSYNNSLL
jgi:hypothetical protein